MAAEGLILARYYMFLQVYFHDIRRAYDFHLTDFLKSVLPDNKYPEDLQEYLIYDDYYIFHLMREAMKNDDENSNKARIIIERKHYKPIHCVELRDENTARWEKEKFYENVKKLKGVTEFKDIDFRTDSASEAPNKFLEEEEDFIYRMEDGDVSDRYKSISYKTDILKNLRKFEILRLYCPESSTINEIKTHIKNMRWA